MKPLAYFAHPLATLAPRDLLLLEALPLRPTDHVLEVGTGSGSSLFRLADSVAAFHGVDVCPGPIDRLRRVLASRKPASADTQLFALDFCDPAAPRQLPMRYDLIFSCDTVEHVPQPAAFFANLFEALEPGGHIFVTYPNEHPSRAHGITFFEQRRSLETMLQDAGFAPEQTHIQTVRLSRAAEQIMAIGWLLPRMLAKKALSLIKLGRSSNSAPQVFEDTDFFAAAERLEALAPVINAYCWGVMKLMSLAQPVHQVQPAPETIWDMRILIRASRPATA